MGLVRQPAVDERPAVANPFEALCGSTDGLPVGDVARRAGKGDCRADEGSPSRRDVTGHRWVGCGVHRRTRSNIEAIIAAGRFQLSASHRHDSCSIKCVSLTYLVPLRRTRCCDDDLFDYLNRLAGNAQVILVDGSPEAVFANHAARCDPAIIHIPVDLEFRDSVNGKAAGVMTGLRRASNEAVVIADDDVRYDASSLARLEAWLMQADVVRPQNYFAPLPWHACLDTARTLINRITGGDWPGTLGVRRSRIVRAGGYATDVLFENLELVRTIVASGGVAGCPLDLYVHRKPPQTAHFWSQRVRQAYDELARPWRLAVWLSVAPLTGALLWRGAWGSLMLGIVAVWLLAAAGRSRAGGRRVFPFRAVVAAPLWVAERAVCTWLAVAAAATLGGIPYHGRIVAAAATPLHRLRARFKQSGAPSRAD